MGVRPVQDSTLRGSRDLGLSFAVSVLKFFIILSSNVFCKKAQWSAYASRGDILGNMCVSIGQTSKHSR